VRTDIRIRIPVIVIRVREAEAWAQTCTTCQHSQCTTLSFYSDGGNGI